MTDANRVRTERTTAEMDGEFVVFVIGMRINRLRKVHKWLPVALAMPRMLRELDADPESGLLHYETVVGWRVLLTIQYWDSFERLREYARDFDREHVPAWASYNESNSGTGDVGIFHETYVVDPGDCESVYNNMPQFGLGAAGTLRRAEGAVETAGKRLGVADDELLVSEDGHRSGGE
ncbi:DUF4188 domain-containing protein [Halorussus limi]|uniref:DUF4188 domain-containing protein n=1 Tax=Halorussus limi TaxID=2938695 RepID=A0A8U0HWD8_9EURY|nr:DUF4188 domain-containing protein [Halorussus limi]UPV75021.1 DUF4188 domain-containing protein [Halorussus limi]